VRGRTRFAFALLLALAAAPGCMTIDTQNDEDYEGPRTYSGVRKDLGILPDAFLSLSIPWVGIALVDLPFSFVADTVILPWTMPREAERSGKVAEETQVATERPPVIQPIAGDASVATANRLYTECAKRLHEQDWRVGDCYSIDAKVEITGADPMRGADYKKVLRDGLARDASDGVLVEWREPSFASDGERVRISAKRASSSSATRLPVMLIVGPCGDGGWRILEEISPGLTRE
jgi:uncharacterized protein YceK